MSITKSSSTFQWSGSGQTSSSGTCTALSTSSDYAQQVYVSIDVVGSPSVGASFTVEASPDGSTYYYVTTLTAGTTAGYYYWVVDVPVTAESVQIVFTAQTGGTSSTIVAQLGQVTGV